MRIGVFGGSFNPPHLAHLALARLARDKLHLSTLRWLPAGQPWQKDARVLAPAADRAVMVSLLIEGEQGMQLDRREVERAGPSYTVDTLRELRLEHAGVELVLILGADTYARLDTWHEPEAIASLAVIAVAAREGRAPAPPPSWAGRSHRFEALSLPPMAVSSTEIRRRAALGQPLSPLVGEAVARYIEEHLLYRAPPGP